MSEIKLKPCPFCGGEAEFHRTPVKTNGGWCDGIVVRCKVCDARTNRILYNKAKHGTDGEYDEVAKAWNTRKPVDKILEQLEEEKKKPGLYVYAVDAYDEAIEIVKGGGTDD